MDFRYRSEIKQNHIFLVDLKLSKDLRNEKLIMTLANDTEAQNNLLPKIGNFMMLSQPYPQEKSFIIQNEATQETKIIKAIVKSYEGDCDLRHILEQIGDPSIRNFRIYVFQLNKYIDLKDFNTENQGYLVPAAYLSSEIIPIKYNIEVYQTFSIGSARSSRMSSENSSVKKQRSKQRTIVEIIEIVKQWRSIHENMINGRKINLQQAAAMIGISKKSLDDYYYQLRLGEKYGFDFHNHLYDKVGVLRSYIKQENKGKKRPIQGKADKHPKNLKIIDEITDISGKKNFNCRFNYQEMIPEQQGQNEMRSEGKSIKCMEQQFYNDFDYMGSLNEDPFLNFSGNFKRVNESEQSDNIFF